MTVQERFSPEQGRALRRFCEAHGVERLAFFGSVVTKHFHSDSDIDVLIEFGRGGRPGSVFSVCAMNSRLSWEEL